MGYDEILFNSKTMKENISNIIVKDGKLCEVVPIESKELRHAIFEKCDNIFLFQYCKENKHEKDELSQFVRDSHIAFKWLTQIDRKAENVKDKVTLINDMFFLIHHKIFEDYFVEKIRKHKHYNHSFYNWIKREIEEKYGD